MRHRADAHCIIHTHTTAGMAVACKQEGLRTDNFYCAQLHGRVAYHDFEGITTDLAEQERLVASLGDKRRDDPAQPRPAGDRRRAARGVRAMWSLQRACEVQVAADSLQGPNVA